jgi:hypothetical protein
MYAQQGMISGSNFEKNLISLEIDTTSPDSKTQLINSSCDANSLTNLNCSTDLALNPEEIKSNQLKSLDVSKRIKMDYSIFIYNQLTITDVDND